VKPVELYKGHDPRDVPRYTVAEAAEYVLLPTRTLHEWVAGRASVIRLRRGERPLLSFWNLVEAYVLATLRRYHGVPLQRVRKALRYIEHELQLERPLIDKEFLTDGIDLFVEEYGRLINASKEGQTAMRELLEASLHRVARDPQGLAKGLYPWSRRPDEPKDVEIDPLRAFGQRVIAGTGIPTSVIADRLCAGDSVERLAADYRVPVDKIGAALRWELLDKAP
jgi:uncharacterized protein (DUF433 family)